MQNSFLSFRLKKYSFLALVLFFLLGIYDVASASNCASDADCSPTETCDKNTPPPYTCHLSSYKCDTATKTCVKVALYTGMGLNECKQSCESHGCRNNSECKSDRAPHRTCTSAGACTPDIDTAGSTIIIKNRTGSSNTFYFRVMSRSIASDIQHLIQKPSTCTVDVDVHNVQHTTCTAEFTLPNNSGNKPIAYNLGNLILPVNISVSAGINHTPQGPCNTTLGEIALDSDMEGYDISLVNGRNYNMQIIPQMGIPINITNADRGVIKKLGVYPEGCSRCANYDDSVPPNRIGVPPPWKGYPHLGTQDCLAYKIGVTDGSPLPIDANKYCKDGTEKNPTPYRCEIEISDSLKLNGDYEIIFNACDPAICIP